MYQSGCTRNSHDNVFVERRSISDRRNKSGISMRSLLFGGRRKSIRRFEDKQKLFYVDQYSQRHFGAIVLILFLSVIDAILTMVLINHGATEINPIMAYYLNVGPYTYLGVKYMLTSVGLMVVLMLRNIFMRPLRIYAGSLFYYLLVAFIGVVSWQIFLLYGVIT